MKNINQCKDMCCGCSSCSIICKKEAIEMIKDEHGFNYPKVDFEKCVDCGECLKVCPVFKIEKSSDLDKAYYGWNYDENVRIKSSSGGVFSCLADKILEENGVVFGAVYDSNKNIVKYSSSDETELDNIRRSKYTESETGDIFIEVEKNLKNGRKVLFCGTPCHIAGLKKFLFKEYENLILCDFVCGGAASPAFFQEHLEKLEKDNNSKIEQINFRDKKNGWKRMTFTVCFENGKKKSTLSYFDSFFNGFIEGIIKRKNCFECPFSDNHFSDITIADYWGYKSGGVEYDKKGISMIIVHSENGKKIFEMLKEKMYQKEMPAKNTKYTIKKRIFNQEKYNIREEYFKLASEIGYEKAAKKTYMKSPLIDLILGYLRIK